MSQFYGQDGEDKVLAGIFSGKSSGTCLEVGANDGVHLSNTYHFEQMGWQCILVEPNGDLCEKIRRCRSAIVFECAASEECGEAVLHVGSGSDDVYSTLQSSERHGNLEGYRCVIVPTRTLDAMLEAAGVASLDFVTIDVEGHEIQALEGFTLSRWKPRLVLLEDNSEMEDTEAEHLMSEAAYFRFWRSGANDWYAIRGTGRVRLLMRIVHSGCFTWRAFLKGTLPRALVRQIVLAKRKLTRKN